MKIGLVAPLYESVPPKLYGGTERIVSYLAEELVREGHDVTLFASGDSSTHATLIPIVPKALRLGGRLDPLAAHTLLLGKVAAAASEFDIVHYHIDFQHFPLSRTLGVPQATTLHGRLDLPELSLIYQEFREMPVVSISNSQREPLPAARWMATVHHGLPPELYTYSAEHGKYLVFLGRIAPEKRVDLAIEIARRADMELMIAAKADPVDREYFETRIRPLLSDPHVRYLGEIGEHEKAALLAGAYALLFPIDWPEPFGLVMIEAMACGTPVVAFRRGSTPEVITDGETGFVVDDVSQAVAALERVTQLSRRRCRRAFENRFTAPRMARDYLTVYRHLCDEEPSWRAA